MFPHCGFGASTIMHAESHPKFGRDRWGHKRVSAIAERRLNPYKQAGARLYRTPCALAPGSNGSDEFANMVRHDKFYKCKHF